MLRDVFEVALYNADVRRLVYDGEHHREYSDDWSNTHFIEVRALNEMDARRKIEQRYPRDRGFVIEAVTQA